MPWTDVAPISKGESISSSLGSIGTTAIPLRVGSTALAGRRGIYVKNTSTVVLLWGFSDSTCVCPLSKETSAGDGTGGEIWLDIGDAQTLFIKSASGAGNTAAVAELK